MRHTHAMSVVVMCGMIYGAGVAAVGAGEAAYTFKFAAPVVVKAGGYNRVTMEGCEPSHKTGEPLLPVKSVSILLPEGKEAGDVTLEYGPEVELAGSYYVEPAAQPYPLSKPELAKAPSPDPTIYASREPYPTDALREKVPQVKKGYNILYLSLCPVRYVPAERKLSYYGQITVRVALEDRRKAVGEVGVRDLEADREDVRRGLVNPGVMDTYTAPVSTLSEPQETYTHVIITTSALKSAFAPLRDHRISRGMSSTIVTTDEIGGSDADTVRNWIKNTAYSQWNTEYVLIGGDDTIFYPKSFWAWVTQGDDTIFALIPVDMYYGNLDAWEDLTTEVYVGRAPVSTTTEATNFVNKTIAYENSMSSCLNKAYGMGEYLGSGGVSDYATDMLEQIRLGGVYDGYYTSGFAADNWFDTSGNLYESDGYSWSWSDAAAVINSGVNTINHLGEGAYNHALQTDISGLSSLTNTDYFFLYSQASSAGWFIDCDCWAEAVVKMESGAFAVVMNAKYGFAESDSTDGPSQRYNRPFWDALFGEGIRELGAMNAYSKEFNIPKIEDNGSRFVCYEENLFGDPAVQIHAEEPGPTPTPTPTPTWDPSEPTYTPTPTATPTPPTVFQDDMENGQGAWTHAAVTSGYKDQWHLSSEKDHTTDGMDSWKCGSTSTGTYASYDDSGLVTPTISLPDFGYVLQFWYWIETQLCYDDDTASDGAFVEISTDGGASWSEIEPEGGYPCAICDLEPMLKSPFDVGTPCYSGYRGWTEAMFDLSSYSGNVKLRFRFGSDIGAAYEGWYIDDVKVYVAPTPAPTMTPTQTPTPTKAPTGTPTPTPTPSATPTAEPPVPTLTPTASPTVMPAGTPTPAVTSVMNMASNKTVVETGDSLVMNLVINEPISDKGKLVMYVLVRTPQGGWFSFVSDGGSFKMTRGIKPAMSGMTIPSLDMPVLNQKIAGSLARGDYWFVSAVFHAGDGITLNNWRSRAIYSSEATVTVR